MNNPIDQYQYSYGSGLVNPYSMLTSTVSVDYYTICRPIMEGDIKEEHPDFLNLGASEGLILTTDQRRLCVTAVGWPSVFLEFNRPFVSQGVNAYGAEEYRWYWDVEHPDSFIGVQLLKEEESETWVRYCIVIDICNGSPLLKGGSFDVSVSTGLVSRSFKVAILQTWMD